MALTDVAVRKARPGAKAAKMTDGGGLYLLISPDGGKWWRVGRLVLDSGELVERASAKRAREIA